MASPNITPSSSQSLHNESDLIQAALDARSRAYCPYSNYQVGAAILTKEGKIFQGCNVENAAYGSTICAERHAIGNAVVNGYKEFVAVVVATKDGTGTPCGSCRQSLNEFSPNMHVITVNPEKQVLFRATLEQLLPSAFGPKNVT